MTCAYNATPSIDENAQISRSNTSSRAVFVFLSCCLDFLFLSSPNHVLSWPSQSILLLSHLPICPYPVTTLPLSLPPTSALMRRFASNTFPASIPLRPYPYPAWLASCYFVLSHPHIVNDSITSHL